MTQKRKTAGFTLMETLVVVGIIAIISALTFVSVISYQRSMAGFELDATAKELYVAAQNHLAMAKNMGLLDQKEGEASKYANGTLDERDEVAGQGIYYFTYPGTALSDDEDNPQSVLDLMLPPFSIDEAVRSGNSFVISYQKSTGRVVDVFFAKTSGQFPHTFVEGEYANLLSYKGDADRKHYVYNGAESVIGWYGADAAEVEEGEELAEPEIEVHNDEKLWVAVTNTNIDGNQATACLKLVVTGAQSKARKTFSLVESDSKGNYVFGADVQETNLVSKKSFNLVLDDITTSGMHFSEVFTEPDTATAFVAGENLKIKAIAYDNSKLTNTAATGTKTVNSLFASIETNDEAVDARIRNFRHLENLDAKVSMLDQSALNLTAASQIANMKWDGFREAIHALNSEMKRTDPDAIQVYYTNGSATQATSNDTYYPISPNHVLTYDGQNHTIANVAVSVAEDAGLFGTLNQAGSSVKDLKLVDFKISSSGAAAGALVGGVSGSLQISNVISYNSSGSVAKDASAIVGTTAAGGLVGAMTNGTLEESAAAMYVTATGENGAAGGLVGTTTGGSVKKCYAGGHLVQSKASGSEPQTVTYSTTAGNVTASGASGSAGGLVGTANATPFENCYATCSAFGAGVAGGLVGTTSSSATITGCYATGLVAGATGTENMEGVKLGAFVGTNDGYTFANSSYLLSINEKNGVKAVSSDTDDKRTAGISEADGNTKAYLAFISATSPAVPYADALTTYYGGTYNFKTANELASVSDGETVSASHYGDWPATETLVVNTTDDTPVITYRLVISPEEDAYYIGTQGVTVKLEASTDDGATYSTYGGTVTWTSSDDATVSVVDTTSNKRSAELGMLAAGEATISASVDGASVASVVVTVIANSSGELLPTVGKVDHGNGFLAYKSMNTKVYGGQINTIEWVELTDSDNTTYFALKYNDGYDGYALVYYGGKYYKPTRSGADWYTIGGNFTIAKMLLGITYNDGWHDISWKEVTSVPTGIVDPTSGPGTRDLEATDTSSWNYRADRWLNMNSGWLGNIGGNLEMEWEPLYDGCMVIVQHGGLKEMVGVVWYNGNYYVPQSDGADTSVSLLGTDFSHSDLTDGASHTYGGATITWIHVPDPYNEETPSASYNPPTEGESLTSAQLDACLNGLSDTNLRNALTYNGYCWYKYRDGCYVVAFKQNNFSSATNTPVVWFEGNYYRPENLSASTIGNVKLYELNHYFFNTSGNSHLTDGQSHNYGGNTVRWVKVF